MNLKVLALCAVFGVMACGTPTPQQNTCNSANCSGCCDASGSCQLGTTSISCGAAGRSCDVCVGSQVCGAGQCIDRLVSQDGGTCTVQTEQQLCAAAALSCGLHEVTDSCGKRRSVMCGVCSATEACSNGACVCQPESDAQLCSANQKNCGTQTFVDRCGRSRTIDCGVCTGSATCGGDGRPGVCGCTNAESDSAFCARNARSCGPLTAVDACGKSRTVASCGTCNSPNTCNAGTCSCAAETTVQFCTRMAANCGTVSGVDACGQPRSANCGTCSGSSTCGGGGVANRCGCTTEDNATFCARQHKNCGSVSAYDNCSAWRSGVNCGTCAGTETCGGGGTSNVCACAPESNSAFLSRLGKNCGSVTAPDNCGVTRTVTASSCSGRQTCGGGGVANVCGCTPETDAELCTAQGRTCGALNVTDRCGVSRTISSCGSCAAPLTCGGGTVSGQCGCTSESDLTFCSRLSANCGELTALDNCGKSRTVASCGTCDSRSICGQTVTNQCGAYVEHFEPFCNPDGWCFEHPAPFFANLSDVVANSANDVWFVGTSFTWGHWNGSTWVGGFDASRGTLNALWSNGPEVWAAGDDGTVVRRVGSSWVDVPKPAGVGTLAAIHGFSATDIWVGGSGRVMARWNGSAWATYSMPSYIQGIWGANPNDVWVVGNSFVSRWNGTSWTTQPGMAWSFSDVAGANANEVWAVSTDGHVIRFNGTIWSDMLNESCSSVWVGAPNSVAIACSSGIRTWDGATWSAPAAPVGSSSSRVLAGAGGALVAAVTAAGNLERLVGSRWVIAAPQAARLSGTLESIQTFPGGEALAFNGLVIFTKSGGVWNTFTTGAASVYGFSARDFIYGLDVWAGTTSILAYRVTGGSRVAETYPSVRNEYISLRGIWAANPTAVFGVGDTGTSNGMFWSTGGTWSSPLPSAPTDGTSYGVSKIHGSSLGNVWAADSGRLIWKTVGGVWTLFTTGSPLGSSDRISSLWVQNDTKTWFGGSFGVVEYDATTGYGPKQSMPTPGTVRGFALHPSTGVHAIANNRLWRRNGSSWTLVSVFPVTLGAIAVDGTAIVVTGTDGHVFRHE